MDIQNRRAVRAAASEALASNPGQPRKLLLAYIASFAGGSLLLTVLSVLVNARINTTGGLGDLGLRSVLLTIRACLPVALAAVLWFVKLGYQKAAIGMARRRAVGPGDLGGGFRFFGPALRLMVLQGVIYTMMDFLSAQVAGILFALTPFAQTYQDAWNAVFANATVVTEVTSADTDALRRLCYAMIPWFCISLPLYAITAAPFFYSCRMAYYVMLDRPGTGALMALGESGRMMHGSRRKLLRYDLGYWWYHLARLLLGSFLLSGMLMMVLGFMVTLRDNLILGGMIAVCLLLLALLDFFFRNRVETTYATVYEALRPQPTESHGGAVLGNIFDLAKDYREE